jgi:predicted RNA-binding Zn ribbon-like protein
MLSRFSFRSGHLALDFAATLMFRDAQPLELLDGPGALAAWGAQAGLASVEAAAGGLAGAVATREAIYRLARGRIAGEAPDPGALETLNAAAARPGLAPALSPAGTLSRSGSADQLVAEIARAAVELLGGPDAQRLRQCARPGCTRLFIDRSRGATRAWCGMRECGNRVNAAAYRARRRTGS